MSRLVTRRINVNNENKEIQFLVTQDSSVFFKCKDMAKMIGYKNIWEAVSKNISKGEK